MTETLLTHGWDGEYFLRAYDHFGEKVGSNTCEEGKIYIEPQGMAVMAGVDPAYARKALSAVKEHLSTEHGIMLHQPAYTKYHLNLGEISSYPPGYKENASVFCHTNPWIMIAEAICGDGQQAMEYYLRINPSAREALSEVHRSEPYVYAQTIAGKDAPTFGEAKNSWLTGTASWNYVAITQWILGIRADYDGLEISPVVPPNWEDFSITRKFRGITYQIDFQRVGSGNNVQLVLDGAPLAGSLIQEKLVEGKDEAAVVVRIG